jgi:hypothetical protein
MRELVVALVLVLVLVLGAKPVAPDLSALGDQNEPRTSRETQAARTELG